MCSEFPLANLFYVFFMQSLIGAKSFHWLLLEDSNGETDDPRDDSVDWCSTSAMFTQHDDLNDEDDDGDPTVCPHGYVCHVIYEEEDGFPNRGRCEKGVTSPADHPPESALHTFRFLSANISASGCIFHRSNLDNGQSFTYEDHPCICQDGAVTCNVALQMSGES
ncbi:hypothetical protein CAPTEDRAFT_229284 [Capitella teleta]|uniref:Uncharacterized protein n=1 Tax=Capitella teleta TaxID=283909 RepID=R7T8J1_CAPTE|nr:hypothetical protein CAPTEDRAFT_229284 [Capitella teleta]|eukprot:ELT89999.1 hypothetical protein CAPTEDRAFT_229284 [Capitella teleta]